MTYKLKTNKEINFIDPFVSGMISKAIATIMTYPLSTIRTRI